MWVAVEWLCTSASRERNSVFRSPQGNGYAREITRFDRPPSRLIRLGVHTHQVPDSLNFVRFDVNPALPLCSPLVVIDRGGLSANNQQPSIGLAKPIVKRGDGDSESPRRFLGCKQFLCHDRLHCNVSCELCFVRVGLAPS